MSMVSNNNHNSTINVRVWQDHAGGILYEPQLLEPRLLSKLDQPVGHELFEPGYWQRRGSAQQQRGGRGSVVFINDSECHWVLRHYRRGGLIGKLIADRYLWWGAEATRAFCEWRLLASLHAQGLPVPKPVAARYVRSGVSYRADLITEVIPQARTLAELLSAAPLNKQGWQQLGEIIARFHAVGVRHADLNAHNIVFDANQHIFLLDFDRGRICSVDPGWINHVLQRLLRSLNKLQAQRALHFQPSDWQHLVQVHDACLAQLRLARA
ncbi:MAG: 3-deoxy-D-manno-octulosonic acid kinase [Steroidobacteraceae bacterium]